MFLAYNRPLFFQENGAIMLLKTFSKDILDKHIMPKVMGPMITIKAYGFDIKVA